MPSELRSLQQLARLYDIQAAYVDVTGVRRVARVDSLRALIGIRSGEPLHGKVADRIRERVAQLGQRWLEPVTVFWEGAPARIALNKIPRASVTIEVIGEGIHRKLRLRPDSFRSTIRLDGLGRKAERIELVWRESLPRGYYDIRIESGGESETGKLFVAPMSPWAHRDDQSRWGLFAPIYALRDARSEGCGTLRELRELMRWAGGQGASSVATLPLLASFLGDEHFDPSPYAPVSRLFWNELYIDMERLAPELAGTRSASSARQIDYYAVMNEKRSRLERVALELYASQEVEELERWVAADPTREAYAKFRARSEGLSTTSRAIEPVRYHRFVQWVMDRQMTEISSRQSEAASLYLDFPLGTHPEGFDVHHFASLFAAGVSAGAPPDLSYASGQDWGFPPMQPDAARAGGYAYWIRCIDQQMKHAMILRIDHVMSLHRLFWVPRGFPAAAGAYVRYRAEELYAILTIESHRHQCTVVGEDLGTVPAYVRRSLDRHNLSRLFVVQRQLTHSPDAQTGEIRRNMVASLNNHDMAPFAAFWEGLDIEERLRLGLISEVQAAHDRLKRQRIRGNWKARLEAELETSPLDSLEEILLASIEFLAKSDASNVLVGLEDLWLETEPQNIPTTTWQRPNWRQEFLVPMEEWTQSSLLRGALERLRDRQIRQEKP